MKYRNDKVAVSIQKYVSDIIQFKVKNKDLGGSQTSGSRWPHRGQR